MRSADPTRKIGLARALSKLGYCSRSQAVELIRAGRVQVNERVRRDPETPVQVEGDRVLVDGRRIEAESKIYLMMNKPRGIVTTASDEKGRETVYSILASSGEALPWVAPVGRLDKASEGLLLLTNDSEWGARIAAPETHLEKTYHVQVGSTHGDVIAEKMMRGVRSDGDFLCVNQARLLRSGEKNCWLEVVLDEGKNRQIRRIVAAMNLEVLRLVRVGIGTLELGTLAKGKYRRLGAEERRRLDRAMADARKQERHG
jgi:23S rRNA pseudouridine2605 synthase